MELAAPVVQAAQALAGQRIAVTGLTGFVGRHLLRALVAGGVEVTCIARASSRVDKLPPDVRVVRADLTSGQGLAQALHGQEAVVHLAALLFGLNWQDYISANARAAQHLGAALGAEMARPGTALRRVVLVSSLAATGPCGQSPGVTDATPPAPVSAYGWSKFLAEQTLARHVEKLGHDKLVILRPPIIYGSGDQGLLPYFRSAKAGLVVTPGLGRAFPVSAIHAHDMAQAIALALAPAAHGLYHCSDGEIHDMGRMGQMMAEVMGRKARVLGLPLPLMGAAAALCGLAGPLVMRLTGRAPSWNPDKYLEAKQAGWLCDASRMRQELAFTPTVSLRDGLREAVAGYRELGLL